MKKLHDMAREKKKNGKTDRETNGAAKGGVN